MLGSYCYMKCTNFELGKEEKSTSRSILAIACNDKTDNSAWYDRKSILIRTP